MDLRKKKKKKSAYTTLRAELLYPPSPANPATHTHLLEQLKLKTPTPPNAGKDVEQEEHSCIAGGNATWCSHFGREMSSFLQN